MNTELDRPIGFVNPFTGEAKQLSLSSPTDELGHLLADIRDLESQLGDLKRALSQELTNRLDQMAVWTYRTPGLELVGQSPEPVEEFDELALREELLGCVDRGELSIEAVDKAVETVVTYKARKAGINAIRKLPGMAERIAPYTRRVEKRRSVQTRRTS